MKIKGAVPRDYNQGFHIEEMELEPPRANEVLVKYVSTGFCHSDLSDLKGRIKMGLPMAVGHECSGVAEAIGEHVTRVRVGDHVVSTFMIPFEWAAGGGGCVAKTTNGGASWQVQMGPGLSDNNGACAVDKNTAWIATDCNTLYRSTDGGTNGQRQNPSLPGGFYLLGVSALGRSTAWVVGGAMFPGKGGVILRTTDTGVTWQVQTTPVDVTLRRVSFVGSYR